MRKQFGRGMIFSICLVGLVMLVLAYSECAAFNIGGILEDAARDVISGVLEGAIPSQEDASESVLKGSYEEFSKKGDFFPDKARSVFIDFPDFQGIRLTDYVEEDLRKVGKKVTKNSSGADCEITGSFGIITSQAQQGNIVHSMVVTMEIKQTILRKVSRPYRTFVVKVLASPDVEQEDIYAKFAETMIEAVSSMFE